MTSCGYAARLFVLVMGLLLSSGKAHCQDTSLTNPPSGRFLGTSTCSTSHCHGSPPEVGRRPGESSESWKSSYTVWSRLDPHAGSYAALFTTRSQRIIRNLLGREFDPRSEDFRVVLRNQCLDCHAVPEGNEFARSPEFSAVSCEACHGPAADWEATHYLKTPSAAKPAQLQDLSVRAKACVRCHVGPGLDCVATSAEVNHDVIAAGHPQLHFEFSAYLAALPAHWHLESDIAGRTQSRRDFFAEAWTAGQHVTQGAVLSQLQRRIRSAKSDPRSAWPEFAEYDCFSCHHGLGQRTGATSSSASGRLRWGNWTFAALESGSRSRTSSLQESYVEFQRGLTKTSFRLTQLEADAATLLQYLSKPHFEEQSQQILLNYVLTPSSRQFQSWNEVTQWYLATQAEHRSLSWQSKDQNSLTPQLEELCRRLQTVRQQLTFDRTATPTLVPTVKWDSPRQFDATSTELVESIRDIQALVQKLARQRELRKE